MINLLPINKKVRETLVKREMAVSRLSSNGRDILEPQSEDTLNLIANESMKSLWVKQQLSVHLSVKQHNQHFLHVEW